ncbi:MAG: acetyl-CoA carboxylase biotin carboxyl carrier protein [Rubrivivax sp.]
MDIDLEELASLIELLKEADFSEFRYERGDTRLLVRRGELGVSQAFGDRPRTTQTPAPPAAPATPLALKPVSHAVPEGAVTVTAPLLGTLYRRPKPGEAPFVQVGDRVEADTVLCIVEVMKLMNSVHAGQVGTVVAIHAEDGELVEFGAALFSIQPDAC